MKKGFLIIVSGFSGVGKGTLMKRLLEKYSEDYCLSVSATTRKPREGEREGIEYFFLDKAEFEKRIGEDKFLEYACYVGNYYGTPKAYVEEKLNAGINVILEIEMQGALKIKEKMPEILLFFVVPPTVSDLRKRLKNRGTENDETINNRIKRACEEVDFMKDYDYIVVNDEVEKAVDTIDSMIRQERSRVSRNGDYIKKLKEDLILESSKL